MFTSIMSLEARMKNVSVYHSAACLEGGQTRSFQLEVKWKCLSRKISNWKEEKEKREEGKIMFRIVHSQKHFSQSIGRH